MSPTLITLALLFGQLSLLAFGGGQTVVPEMQRQVVDVHHWMTAADFAALFALAQAAPGPTMLLTTLIGLRAGGIPGALVATLGMVLPSSLLTIISLSLWERFRAARWRKIIQAGLLPATVGLFVAAALLIAHTADQTFPLTLLTLAVAAVTLLTKLHPLWLLAAGAGLGVLGIV